ncbi:MAG TPA: ferritin-like domain-containing protein [Anaeromyxobacter sp.]|nr:ferritin-like domain-containing protein [Anaeromyxobacter sp.]
MTDIRHDPLRAAAARAWRFRCGVEREANLRFARLAGWLEGSGFPGPLVEMALRASSDERRHAARCAETCEEYGGPIPDLPWAAPAPLAPRSLPSRAALLYEAVAACCVTETGSVGVLTTLLGSVRGGRLRRLLRELAADEVLHSRLGWAVLASERDRGTASLLGPFVPAMLSGSIDPGLFEAGGAFEEDPALLEHGVLPHALKREVFTRTTLEVVLPGLEAGGIDTGPARRWLWERLGGVR